MATRYKMEQEVGTGFHESLLCVLLRDLSCFFRSGTEHLKSEKEREREREEE
jgi:hypothetical protein